MNSNMIKDDSLGTTEVDLRAIEQNQWKTISEKLVDGDKGELDFQIFFQPTDYHRVVLEWTSMLHIRVNGALNLKNLDTGILGDVSDPYVVVKVGEVRKN